MDRDKLSVEVTCRINVPEQVTIATMDAPADERDARFNKGLRTGTKWQEEGICWDDALTLGTWYIGGLS